MIVLDASAAIELLLNSAAGQRVAARIAIGGPLHAPHLLDVEVASVLRRFAADGSLTAERGAVALGALREMSLQRHTHDFLLERIWDLRGIFTAYDAVYVALAEALGAPLVTLDRRLGRAGGHRAEVEVIAA